MTADAAALGIPEGEWPETVEYNGKTWRKEKETKAADGEVQFVDYTDEAGRWLIVYRDN
jgi:hypothetical protein